MTSTDISTISTDDVWRETPRGQAADIGVLSLPGIDAVRSFLPGGGSFTPPVAHFSGRKLVSAEPGRVVFSLPKVGWYLSPKGAIHPGIPAFLADAPPDRRDPVDAAAADRVHDRGAVDDVLRPGAEHRWRADRRRSLHPRRRRDGARRGVRHRRGRQPGSRTGPRAASSTPRSPTRWRSRSPRRLRPTTSSSCPTPMPAR
ncbi:hypothetical protein [Nocardioides sp. B-3]|uniref:hypothetical protein n=1 Tax=Nocardioides sp. B-3 TaxID=2895565 RepID=UPI0021538F16|nr:hypothetical protein [Nocardioides sp. B-3]UUZ60507.1 hypothetical protein LP418_06440 [Nocardioides sp. B-3]